MQPATNSIKSGYKIRKLEQFENQNIDIYETNGGCHYILNI